MTFPEDRIPRSDKNRRIWLGISREDMAAAVGTTPEQLRLYEFTQPDRDFDIELARRVGVMLDRLEAEA